MNFEYLWIALVAAAVLAGLAVAGYRFARRRHRRGADDAAPVRRSDAASHDSP